MIYKNLNNAIIEVLKKNNWYEEDLQFFIQRNKKNKFGELFTNVSLIVSNKFNLDIEFVSNKIKNSIDTEKYNFIKINILNGYLNFFHKKSFLNNIVYRILEEKEKFGSSNIGKGLKVNYEWVSANPTGYLHVGHARNVVVGSVVANLFEFSGYKVEREFYINDFGLQVYKSAKTVYFHYSKLINQEFKEFEEMYKNPEVKVAAKFLFDKFKDDFKNLKWKTEDFTKKEKLFSKNIIDFFLNEIKKDCEIFGVKFDIWFSESSLYENNNFEEFKNKFIEKKISYKKDGALWIKTKQFGISDDIVLIKSTGFPTYFMGDLMYHNNKYKRGYDLIFDLWGADHQGHFYRVGSGIKALGWDEKKYDVNFLQMVKIIKSDGKILKLSKRAGNTVYLRDMVKEYGIEFINFMLISKKRSINFVLDLSLLNEKTNKNPFYYTQYAYARALQMIKKIESENNDYKNDIKIDDYSELVSESEKDLILSLYELRIIIEKSTLKQEPQLLIQYILTLSKKFHIFYQNNRIIGSEEIIKLQRINLVKAFLQVMDNVFKLIGIKPFKKM